MNPNTMELDLDAMENVSGGKIDAETKAVTSGLSVATFTLTGGAFGSFCGPVGTTVGATVGAAVGGACAAVLWLIN